MAFSVTAVATHMVQPAHPTPSTFPATLPPSVLDFIVSKDYVETVFIYPSCPAPTATACSRHDFFNSDILRRSLGQTLSFFYPFAGTVTGDLTTLCNGNGALFVDAVAACSIADFGEFTSDDPQLQQLVPKVDASQDISVLPVLLIQVTRFQCGGVAFGMALRHYVGDGPSAIAFLRAWSSLVRGEPLTSFPDFDKDWLRARSPPSPEFTHDEYLRLPRPRMTSSEHQPQSTRPADADRETVSREFKLPVDFLQKLKLMGAGRFTTFEMLGAHVWRCCCEARKLLPQVESMLVTVAGARGRLKGPVSKNPQDFVGNAVFNCCAVLAVGEILESSVVAVAEKIHAAITRMDDAYCRSAIDFLETRTRAELASYGKGPHTFASPNVGFSDWAKLPFYDIDFGWGKPTYTARVNVRQREGLSTLLRSPHATGTLHLFTTLQRGHMDKFAELLFNPPHSPTTHQQQEQQFSEPGFSQENSTLPSR